MSLMDRASTPKHPQRGLRELLASRKLEFALEAHDVLSARIAERAGFPCLWLSGLALSTTLGARDANEIAWTDIVRATEVIADGVEVPVLVDGDNGHGDFNIARRFIRRLGQAGAAGVCLEDKQFPKINSFRGDCHALVDMAEFGATIAACKEHQTTSDFCLVARTEALIAGHSLDEALARCEAYQNAGADAVMIHSRASVADEVVSFGRRWDGRLPLVVSPTTYGQTPADVLQEAGVSMVIWANHTIRAAAAAMSLVAREIHERETVEGLATPMAALEDIFALMRYEELERARERHGNWHLERSR